MSILSGEAKQSVIRRVADMSLEEIRSTTNGQEYIAGYVAGATRTPTDEEIEAGARGLYEAMEYYQTSHTWEDLAEIGRERCREAVRNTLHAIQGKATEE